MRPVWTISLLALSALGAHTDAVSAVPQVYAVDPSGGEVGDLIGIAGSGFVNSSSLACRFGQANASIYFYKTDAVVYVHVPAQPSDYDSSATSVLVTCSNDGLAFSKGQPHDYFSYL